MRFPLACLLAIGFADLVIADEPEKIVNALDAYYGEFPCAASIRVNTRHRCGGAIITNQHILTAAHCLDRAYIFQLTVVTGTSFGVPRATANSAVSNGVTHMVVQMFRDGRYRPNAPNFWDIAVIKLAAPMIFNEFQNKINLPNSYTPRHARATVIGWGSLMYNYNRASAWLQKLNVEIISYPKCQLYFPRLVPGHCICAESAADEAGINYGDSGSPLIYNGQAIGILSSGLISPQGYPSIYVNVFEFRDFIEAAVSR